VSPGGDTREPVDLAFVDAIRAIDRGSRARDAVGSLREGTSLDGARALALFGSQLASRHLDLCARWLRSRGIGFYTIGSSGHEGNAAVAAALRVSDPALLHYRSGAFFAERARMHLASGGCGVDPIRDVLLGMVAAKSEPIAGGRHKVWGNHAIHVIPQTSTIASHLPRAVGVALAIERATKIGVACAWPADAVVVCSFGDASANHSTATGAINTAAHCAHQHLKCPLLLVCEDNGIGISVTTPAGWIRAAYGARAGLRYFEADGGDLAESFDVASEAASFVRQSRRPAFLHLRTVRLMGHAGSDVESVYRSPEQIRDDLARDPLVRTAKRLIDAGIRTPGEVLAQYEAMRAEVRAIAGEVAASAQLASAAEVMVPLAPRTPASVAREASRAADDQVRGRTFEGKLPEHEGALTLALAIQRTLADLLAKHPELLIFGEDVGRKGGVYGVTRGLIKKAGAARVFDTLLDEQSILGLALGAGIAGLLPIPEIQYLAYLHNAEDQLRGEAATLSFFSQGQYRNPLVVRIAGYGYQKGFGGHFHNDDAIAVLRDIPGIVIASPSRPDDAAAMLRTCVAAAKVDGSVCVYLEPIALYHSKDLHREGDGAWLAPYAAPSAWRETHVEIGRARTHGAGGDLTIVTFANGVAMSLRVARRLESEGIGVRVVDLRWLAPLPERDLLREAEATGRVLVVDETRKSGGVSEGVIAALVDARFAGRIARVTSHDSFVPLGDAALRVLLDEETIESAARALVREGARR
jgi:2-oxoisovalerate dehydrogenase E1 component